MCLSSRVISLKLIISVFQQIEAGATDYFLLRLLHLYISLEFKNFLLFVVLCLDFKLCPLISRYCLHEANYRKFSSLTLSKLFSIFYVSVIFPLILHCSVVVRPG